MNPTPFLKTMEEGVILFDAFPRARSPLDEGLSFQEEIMKIPPSIDDQDLRSLFDDEANLVIEEEKSEAGDNTVMTMETQAPHEERDGALAPKKETLTLL